MTTSGELRARGWEELTAATAYVALGLPVATCDGWPSPTYYTPEWAVWMYNDWSAVHGVKAPAIRSCAAAARVLPEGSAREWLEAALAAAILGGEERAVWMAAEVLEDHRVRAESERLRLGVTFERRVAPPSLLLGSQVTRPDGAWGHVPEDTARRFREHEIPVEDVFCAGALTTGQYAPMWAVDLWGQKWRLGTGWWLPLVALARACRGLREAEARELCDAAYASAALSGEDAAVALAEAALRRRAEVSGQEAAR